MRTKNLKNLKCQNPKFAQILEIFAEELCIVGSESTKQLLAKSFQKDVVLLSEVAAVNARVFFMQRHYLKGLNHQESHDVLDEKKIFGLDVSHIFLIHSPVSVGKDFKEVQRANREAFLKRDFCFQPQRTLQNQPPLMSQDLLERIRALEREHFEIESFHRSALEYWKSNSEHYNQRIRNHRKNSSLYKTP